MSIASEIQDLQTNLQAAKSAVTTKGGTVGDTGLAGLATEIASIPSGGVLDNYGTVTYVDQDLVTFHTVTMLTLTDYFELCTLSDASSTITINNTSITKSYIKEIVIAEGVDFIPDNFGFNIPALTKLELPDSIVYIGDSFNGPSTSTGTLNLKNVKYIGASFMSSSLYSTSAVLSLPSVEFIGNNFLQGRTTFNSVIEINNNCKVIGSYFMAGCRNFNRALTLPSGLEKVGSLTNPESYFMNDCRAFTGPLVCNGPIDSTLIPHDNNSLASSNSSAAMHTTGITLTGPYAEAWKTALPDRTSSPYRKLIVGS